MSEELILEVPFRFIQNIEPVLDSKKKPRLFTPQKKYKNKNNLPLHKYGNGPYCAFRVPTAYHCPGVYVFQVGEQIKYIGKCDDLAQRINNGYGNISPRNCYERGQSTNCRINQLVLKSCEQGELIKLFFLDAKYNKDVVEEYLIKHVQPDWNIQLKANNRERKITPSKIDRKTDKIKNSDSIIDEKRQVKVGNKYKPLYDFLIGLKKSRVTLTFSEIEDLLGGELPTTAKNNNAWWSNNPEGHVQAKSWLNAGFRTRDCDLDSERVTFTRS